MNRELTHSEVIDLLNKRGFNTNSAKANGVRMNYNNLKNRNNFSKDTPTHEILNWLEIQNQDHTKNNILNNSDGKIDFSKLSRYSDRELVVRMMYYMISFDGKEYTKNDIIEDIERIVDLYPEAVFDESKIN